MRSRPELPSRFLFVAAALLLSCALAAAADAVAPAQLAAGQRPTEEQVTRALEKIKADPDLAGEHKVRTLHWVESNADEESEKERRLKAEPGWVSWIGDLFRWFAQSARALVWTAIAVAVGLLVVFIVRLVRERGLPQTAGAFVAPTHVRDLDIRPESLPPDVGASALALWESGEHRAALALLYRALLSRLVNVHRVPILHSSTEGDCLALAVLHLREERFVFASRLVRIWQRYVYGGIEADPQAVRELCHGFAAALDEPDAPVIGTGEAAEGQPA